VEGFILYFKIIFVIISQFLGRDRQEENTLYAFSMIFKNKEKKGLGIYLLELLVLFALIVIGPLFLRGGGNLYRRSRGSVRAPARNSPA